MRNMYIEDINIFYNQLTINIYASTFSDFPFAFHFSDCYLLHRHRRRRSVASFCAKTPIYPRSQLPELILYDVFSSLHLLLAPSHSAALLYRISKLGNGEVVSRFYSFIVSLKLYQVLLRLVIIQQKLYIQQARSTLQNEMRKVLSAHNSSTA